MQHTRWTSVWSTVRSHTAAQAANRSECVAMVMTRKRSNWEGNILMGLDLVAKCRVV